MFSFILLQHLFYFISNETTPLFNVIKVVPYDSELSMACSNQVSIMHYQYFNELE